MNFEESEEQALLRTSLGQFLAHNYTLADRIAASRSEPGWRPDVWRALGDRLELLALGVPRELGGIPAGGAERMIVMEACGRALVLEPVAETLFEAAPLLAKAGTQTARAVLSRIPSGEVRLSVAALEPDMGEDFAALRAQAVRVGGGWRLTGTKCIVAAAPWATHLLVAARSGPGDGGLSLFLVLAAAAGLSLHEYATIDGRRAADVVLAGVVIPDDARLGREGDGLALLEEWRDRGIAAMAAEAVGVLGRLLDDTVAYAKERHQFGQAIGSFQALQHRMVDMHLHHEMLRAAALIANLRLDGDMSERSRACSAAKVTLAEASRFIGQGAVQIHGAMGMTDELAVGHYFKRATAMEQAFGRADWHRRRHASLPV